jgi:hypothetical protein
MHLGSRAEILCKFYANTLHQVHFAYIDNIRKRYKLLLPKASGSNSVVESQPSKLLVAGSIPVSRSMFSITYSQ